jgi:hypothetical protein
MGDATWTGQTSSEFTLAANWSPNGVPTGTAIFEANGAPTAITVSAQTTIAIQSIDYSNTVLDFTGAGIVDNSSNAPTFTVLGGSQGAGSIYFDDSASAGDATILLPATQLSSDDFVSGVVIFGGDSSAGNATITAATNGGVVVFEGASSAGSAKISVAGSDMEFEGSATAANATITNTGVTSLQFTDTSTAGDAVINDNADGGSVEFFDDAVADGATINVDDSALYFLNSSSAGTATINNNGGAVYFENDASGADAVINNNSGQVYFTGSGPSGNGDNSVDAIAGPGSFIVDVQLTVGSDNLSTTVGAAGAGGLSGSGSLVKVGSGTLTLEDGSGLNGLIDVPRRRAHRRRRSELGRQSAGRRAGRIRRTARVLRGRPL